MKKQRRLSEERRQEILQQMNKSESGILIGEVGSPLTGEIAVLGCWLTLYAQCQQGGVLYNLVTPATEEVIASELSAMATHLMSISVAQKMLMSGLVGYILTTRFELSVTDNDVSQIEMHLEPVYLSDD